MLATRVPTWRPPQVAVALSVRMGQAPPFESLPTCHPLPFSCDAHRLLDEQAAAAAGPSAQILQQQTATDKEILASPPAVPPSSQPAQQGTSQLEKTLTRSGGSQAEEQDVTVLRVSDTPPHPDEPATPKPPRRPRQPPPPQPSPTQRRWRNLRQPPPSPDLEWDVAQYDQEAGPEPSPSQEPAQGSSTPNTNGDTSWNYPNMPRRPPTPPTPVRKAPMPKSPFPPRRPWAPQQPRPSPRVMETRGSEPGLDKDAVLARHNYWRAQHAAQPLEWDDSLAKAAQVSRAPSASSAVS